MRGRDLRLVPVAGAAWAGALLCVYLPEIAPACGGVAILMAMAMLVLAIRGRGHDPFAVLAVAGAVVAAVALGCVFSEPVRGEAAEYDGRRVEVVADVVSSPSSGADGRIWFDAQSVEIGPQADSVAISVPLRIGADPSDAVEPGARLRVTGEVQATQAGERAALVVFAGAAEVVAPASGAFAIAAALKDAFTARAVRLPEPGAGLLPGLAVGDTRAVDAELNDAMLASGLSHLTAVSGANCAIVVGAVFWLVALCGGGRRLRVVLALAGLAGFVVLVTPEPSVVRAGTMAGVAMLAILLGRPSAGVSVLALAIIGILVTDPWLASSPGFALSAAATGALILLAPPLSRGLARWMPQPLALGIAVPVAAQVVCGPIIALFSEQQSLVGIPANLIAAPAAPIATVIGLLACLAAPVPILADLLAASAWLPAAWVASTAHVAASVPGAQMPVVPGILSALVVLLISAAVAVLLFRGRSGDPPGGRLRMVASGVLVIAVALAGGRVLLDGPIARLTTPAEWSIAACDVGQGDAIVVRSHERIALIDTGPEPEPLETCLRSLGVERIDLLVLTHFDLDHVGGVDAVVGRVDTVLHGPAGDAADVRLLSDLVAAGSTAFEASTGQGGELGEASWRVLWPRAGQAAFPAGNDASVVVEFEGGGIPRSLFLGDLSAAPQRLLRTAGLLRPPYAVVKVAHHGSADQDAGLYEALRPSVALFSVGSGNDYGHPREEALGVVEAAGAAVLRTDLQGRVLVGLTDAGLATWTERDDAPAPADGGG